LTERIFKVTVEGVTPILMHKFPLDQEAFQNLTLQEKIRESAYIDENGLYAPNVWFKGALINAFLEQVPAVKRKQLKNSLSPYIRIEPLKIYFGKKEYSVNVAVVSIKRGCKEIRYRPQVDLPWSLSFKILTTLPRQQYPDKIFKDRLEYAGQNVGVGDNRINGYGRFKVSTFKTQHGPVR